MDAELARLMTLVDHGNDSSAVAQWFAAVEESYRDDSGQAASWDEFVARFYEKAQSFDSSTVNWFLEKADAEFDDALRVLERFYTQVGAGRAAATYADARTELGLDHSSAAGAAGEEDAGPDWERFAAFLDRDDHGWQQTWPQSREWLDYTARDEEGFSTEIDSFLAFLDQGYDLAQVLEFHGATPPVAEDAPDWERFAALLAENQHRWRMPWVAFHSWLLVEAEDQGLTAEAGQFVEYVAAGYDVVDAAYAFGAVAAAEPPPEEPAAAGGDEAEEPEYAQAAAELQDIVVAGLRGRSDLTLTDELIASVLAERLQARAAASA